MMHINKVATLLLGLTLAFNFLSCSHDAELVNVSGFTYTPTGEFLASPAGYRDPNTGLLIVYNKDGSVKKQIDAGCTTMDFKKWIFDDGTIRYTYLRYDKNTYAVSNVGYNPGEVVLLDQDFKEINKFALLPNGEFNPNGKNALDGHDFILLSDTHYISMAYYEKNVTNIPQSLNPSPNCKVIAPIIQEVKDGAVVWEWDGTNYPELYSTSVEGNDYTSSTLTQDYAHLNSIFIDKKDNNLIISFRNLNQVMKVDRTTGNILWRLGGKNSDFAMTPEQKFLRQHHAHLLEDGKTMILFDNGDLDERPFTRIVEYTLDEQNKKITNYKSMYLPDRSFSRYMGSVEKTDSSYFIGCGADPRVIEVDLNTGQKIFEQKLGLPSYRAYRY